MNQDNKVEEVKNFYSVQSNNDTRIGLHKNQNVLCPQLQSLNMSFCKLSKIPKIIFDLKHLTELDLSNNSLMSLPNEIGNLHNLLILNLSVNKLTSLPASMKCIHNLNSLDISYNSLFQVPDILYNGLGVLKVLDLSFNKISDFNCAPRCINTLAVLKISRNKLIEMPKWIFYNLCQLMMIDIGGNWIFSDIQMNDFCTARVFESLQFLNVENCNLSCGKIQFLSHFKNLEVLCVGNKSNKELAAYQNYLGNLKIDALKNFKILKCLYLQCVQISTLPLGFDCMKNLEILDLSENLLSWLPECLCDLVSLRILNLTSNQLLFLPNTIHKLVNLQELHVGNNNLCYLPETINNLNNLQFADFYNNKLEEFDFMIFKNEKLKGIDLEFNCLEHSFSELENKATKMQYESLKNSLRKRFNYINSRYDVQNLNISSENENYSPHELSDWSDPLSDEDLVVTTSQKQYQADFREEDWEEQIIVTKEDDLFDPNEVKYVSRQELCNFDNIWKYEFRDNYCPAYNHVPSIMKTYLRNIKSTLEHGPVEGQFDSD